MAISLYPIHHWVGSFILWDTIEEEGGIAPHEEKRQPLEEVSRKNDYTCFDPNALRRHLKKHSREKLNKCTQCGYSYSQADDLKMHLKIHIEFFIEFDNSGLNENYFSPNQERKSTFSYRWELLFSQRREKTHILVDTRITVLWRELLLEKYTKNGQIFWTTRIACEKSNSRSYTPRKSNSHRRELLFSPFLQTRIV